MSYTKGELSYLARKFLGHRKPHLLDATDRGISGVFATLEYESRILDMAAFAEFILIYDALERQNDDKQEVSPQPVGSGIL